jgi:hypothetical protein
MKFLYTDTDSLVVWLKTQDLKKDISQMQEWFESDATKGLPGVMKIEKDNIVEFGAYSPKHYYYIQKVNGKYIVPSFFKGIPGHVRDKPLKTQEDIIEHLKQGQKLISKNTYDFTVLRSKNHQIMVKNIQKTVSDEDDKRYYIDEFHTLALGHYSIPNNVNNASLVNNP